MTRIVTLVLGYFFLVLGVLGLVLPFLQGFLFIFIGLILLSKHATWANRALSYIRERWPAMGRMIEKAEGMAESWIDKATHGMRRLVGRA